MKKLFPYFEFNPNVIYLNNAATTHKPIQVVEKISNFYKHNYGTVNRGENGVDIEQPRSYIASCLKTSANNLIFTKGATEAINLVASSLNLKGKDVLITDLEHHSNYLPWIRHANAVQMPTDDNGVIKLDYLELSLKLRPNTKLVAIPHVSNVFGSIQPIREISKITQKFGVGLFVDGSQSIPHMRIDLSELNCDFFCFSGHKVYGPTGIGVLYVSPQWMDQLDVYHLGGGHISNSEPEIEFFNPPHKFEAGTPPMAQIKGLEEAFRFLCTLDFKKEGYLLDYMVNRLKSEDFQVIGNPRIGLVSFMHERIHPYDIASYLAQKNIIIRSGQHCSFPALKKIGLDSVARASLAVYNDQEDIDKMISELIELKSMVKSFNKS